jgi:hypothetical protein
MNAGFRPGSDLPLSDPASKINGKYGLDPNPKTQILYPDRVNPEVAAEIEKSWQDVKRSAIVTFVVDMSGSMSGTKLEQAKDGMIRALDAMAVNNQVGFLSFSDQINNQVSVAPLSQNRFVIADVVRGLKAQGNTALYEAVNAGIKMSDSVSDEEGAIRAVVVLTDGLANRGNTDLDDIIDMISRNELAIRKYSGFDGDLVAIDEGGNQVAKKDIIGNKLAIATSHSIQIFFIGIGEDADMEVGRMLAQATGAEFQGVTEKDLAQLLEEFSKYF